MNKSLNGLIIESDRTLTLHDGRTLGFAEYGQLDGNPIFYFHGHPGCRYEARLLAKYAKQLNIRIISVDRPGLGLSSYKSGRKILDWSEDIIEFADALKIERFAVVGFSGGGPYALACAYKIPDRLTACAVISGVGKMSAFVSFLSLWMPWIILPLSRKMFCNIEKSKDTLLKASNHWPEVDRNCLNHTDVIDIMAISLMEALRPGFRGAALDGGLIGKNFGFRLEDIKFPNISLWHGGMDREIPISVGRTNAEKLQTCNARFFPEEGHISLIVNHGKEILADLIS
ncbi:MAG: alpha/beta hydrolase [Oscillospiraceae bacterium]|nr:alpha/beta hydrolase [Oscillospiraceae bacterium]